MKQEWTDALLKCAETLFIADENSKKIVWTNAGDIRCGETCHSALFGSDTPCRTCPALRFDEVYIWDLYDDKKKRWLKVKSLLLDDNGHTLRVCNLNTIDDSMRLSRDSVEQISELQKLLNENRRMKCILESEASHDRMTGLLNRNRFNLDLTSGMFDRPGTGVLYFDLNNLKEVNDKFRHEAGDRLILCLAGAITATSQLYPGSYAYRVGGDEFVLMLTGCTADMLRQAHQQFYRCMEAAPSQPPCIAAVGEAFSESGCDGEKLIQTADRTMYEDKQRLKSIKPQKSVRSE